jgi:transposase InsO family protein
MRVASWDTRSPITCAPSCRWLPWICRWVNGDRHRGCFITPTKAGSHAYQDELKKHGLILSMSGRGQCWDNAVAESFFGTMKCELDLQRRHQTHDEDKAKVFGYIKVFYNHQRLHSFNGNRTPAQAEAEAAH